MCTCNANAELPLLYRRVTVPSELHRPHPDGPYAGDIRIGDLTGDGRVDFLVFRSAERGMKPCFLGAFDLVGHVLWSVGEGGDQPERPGPVAIHDIDGDGRSEVICLFREQGSAEAPGSMENVVVQVRDGATGEIKREAGPASLRACRGKGANWSHQRLLVANLRGTDAPRDIVVKLGVEVLALDQDLNVLWTHTLPWNEYGRCASYIPAVGDVDGDGRDEVTGGYYLLDEDGTPLWEDQLAPHMDSVAICPWDGGHTRVIASGAGHVLDESGNVILKLGEDVVPHGQEVRVARFTDEFPAPQMIVRHNGHRPDLMLVSNDGRIVKRFRVNAFTNNTGMEAVHWLGPDEPALLFNGGVLWRGTGELFSELPGLPAPVGDERMAWYHCIPADVCGDAREELVLYNPWDRFVYIYTPSPLDEAAFSGYHARPRQYNVRLMD